jgi:DNA-binding MarR family transcriptional regulator
MTAKTQARRLYDAFAELARRYQHRDVDVAAYRGLTVSQTHVLEHLDAKGASTMGTIAAASDRRVCVIAMTARGKATIEAIREELAVEYGEVLSRVPAAHRESVIAAVGAMLELFTARQNSIYERKGRVRAAARRVASTGNKGRAKH